MLSCLSWSAIQSLAQLNVKLELRRIVVHVVEFFDYRPNIGQRSGLLQMLG